MLCDNSDMPFFIGLSRKGTYILLNQKKHAKLYGEENLALKTTKSDGIIIFSKF